MNELIEAMIQQAIEDYRAGLPDAVLFLQQAGLLGPDGLNRNFATRLQEPITQH